MGILFNGRWGLDNPCDQIRALPDAAWEADVLRSGLTRRDFVRAGVGAAAMGSARGSMFGGVVAAGTADANGKKTHVWEKVELEFTSTKTFANPYTDATVWVD